MPLAVYIVKLLILAEAFTADFAHVQRFVLSTETADRNVYNLRISDLQFCTRNRQRTIRFSRASMHDILIDIDFTVCGRYCEALDLVYQVCHR